MKTLLNCLQGLSASNLNKLQAWTGKSIVFRMEATMIEKFEDLDLENAETAEQVDEKLQEKLGINLAELKEHLAGYVVGHAEEMTHEFTNIAPHGDYSKILEDNDSMATFLKDEASKPEQWHLQGLTVSDIQKNLLQFHFANKAVDDGTTCEGFVYVSFQGKVKHAFAQGNDG